MKILWAGMAACVLALSPGIATAGSADHASHVQASMVVTGTIVINPDGSVADYTLDQKDKLPPGVLKQMAKALPHWVFRPVLRDGKAVLAKSHMSVRLVANPVGHGNYTITINGAHFGKGKPGETITKKHISAPRYPRQLVLRRVSGTVYVTMQVGRDGHVERVKIRQVDLRTKGRPEPMKRWRQALANACARAAKDWTFSPPVKGPHRDDAHWVVMMPVNFRTSDRKRAAYGQWQAYIPGPTHYIPWMDQHMLAAGADAVPANGGLYSMQQSLHLLTQLGDGS
ncbi:MAG TPA: energy transducer TonB [Oleiagrimonas sp.]|nr:energy transducer TonB [Oleiagrimonas sp.]